MDLLKKSLAPITDKAWEEINDQAKKVFSSLLTGRKIADFDGPHGPGHSSVALGRIDVPKNQSKNAVHYGVHKIQPMLELRVNFRLNIWELDNIIRGAEDVDLEPMEKAAEQIAEFEENAIYHGFKKGQITGLKEESAFDIVKFPETQEEIVNVISDGTAKMQEAYVEGPYNLVLPPQKWELLLSMIKGYPLTNYIENIIGGKIIAAPKLKESYLISTRGGDFRLTVGQDLAIGYDHHDNKEVELFFTESFTFRVIEPAAVMVFE